MATTRTSTRHVVVVRPADKHDGPVQIEELAGAAGILPGHLLTYDGSGDVIVHGTADGNAGAKLFANITLTPDTITSPTTAKIDLAYANGDTVYIVAASPQDLINTLLAVGSTAIKGSPLASNGDGTLKVVAVDAATLEGAIVAYADEAVDNSGGAAAVRLVARVA